MAFTLNDIVPWGRSFAEYTAMFALTDADLAKRILGCGDGPAGFNAELTRRGEPLFPSILCMRSMLRTSARAIDETFDDVMRQTRENMDEFVWQHIRSLDELAYVRMKAIARIPCRLSGRQARTALYSRVSPRVEFCG